MKMRKISLFATAFAVCGALMCLNSCEKDRGLDPFYDDETVVDQPEPTTDQMLVRLTADLPAAVLSNFGETSTGAALKRRLKAPTPAIVEDTRLVLVEGSDLMKWDDETFDKVVTVVKNGGYLAIETLTGTEMKWFAERLVERERAWEEAYIDEHFDIQGGAQNAVSSSAPRWEARLKTILDLGTRAGAVLDDSVVAEVVAFSNVAYCYMAPFLSEFETTVSSTDAEDNLLDSGTVTVKKERTAYDAGEMADGVVEWLDRVEAEKKAAEEETESVFPATRAGTGAINDLMNASEQFTLIDKILWRRWDNATITRDRRVFIDIYSWGMHNMETKTDYYYIQEKILLRMGPVEANGTVWKIYYPTEGWKRATNYGSHNSWYGAFLSKYENSLNLSGKGTIKLIEALPYTDNTSGSKAIIIGSTYGTSQSIGATFSGAFSANPGFNIGGSYSYGWSESNSFTLNTTQTYKDLGVVKSSSGDAKVAWTYKANKPTFYIEEDSKSYYFKHTMAPDILVNDVNLDHEVCWSVTNPSGAYTLSITSAPQTAALMYILRENSKDDERGTDKYEYTDTPVQEASHTFLQPGRARQLWRMEVVVDEKYPDAPYSARKSIEDDLRQHFSSCYKQEFEICDQTETSVNVIDALIKASKEVFNKNLSSLRMYAEDVGVIQYTIRWNCDSPKITPRTGYTVRVQ